MNNKTVFVRTRKGEAEANGQTSLLFGDAKRAFMLVNNKSNVDELRKHAAPSLRPQLEEVLEQLESDDFICDKNEVGEKTPPSRAENNLPRMAVPKISVPSKAAEQEDAGAEDELDFTSLVQQPREESGAGSADAQAEELDFSSMVSGNNAEADRARAEAEAKAKAEAEARAKAEAESRDKAEAESRARAEAEARAKAEAEARKKAEAEARVRAEAETRMKAEAEAKARLRAELEAKVRAEAEAKARAEAEARMRAEEEAKVRLRAEMESKMRAEAEAKARAEAEARLRAEAEVQARFRAELEEKMRAEAESKARAETEARKRAEAARAEAEAKARAEAEARAKAEAEIRARAEAEARAKAEAEIRARAEAEAQARHEAESKSGAGGNELDFSSILQTPAQEAEDSARIEAEAKARMEVEARTLAEAEAKAKALAETEAKVRAEAEARARVRAELEAGMRAQVDDSRFAAEKPSVARSMIATVLFFDVVGYTKQSVAKQIELKGQFNTLISGFIGHVDEGQRIILDTGDGAAIGFMQHPEDALDVAMKFRAAVTANNHRDYPELKVRAGIHLGPVSVVKDMNGQLNMVGDGINDAQRIMSFAGIDQIYVSRSYFDVISRLTADSARLFKYNGTQKDKHGREHQVYLVMGEGAPATAQFVNNQAGGLESLMLDLSSLMKDSANIAAASQARTNAAAEEAAQAWKPMDLPQSAQAKSPEEIEAEARMAVKIKAEQAAEAARIRAQQEAAEKRARAEQEAAKMKHDEEARKLSAEQAKAFAEAEKRANERAKAEAKAREREAKQAKRQASAAPSQASRPRKIRQPLPLITVGVVLVLLAVVAVVALPYVWPMQDYIPLVEKELSGQLKQPVHIGSMSAVSLPAPRLDLRNITVGKGQELKIGHVALDFDVFSLPANVRVINKAEMENVVISAESFGAVMPWFQAMGSNARFSLERLEIHGVKVSGDVPALPSLDGKMDFDAYGRLVQASLNSADGKLGVNLQPQAGHMQLDVSFKDSLIPLIPGIQFSSLDATGTVGSDAINFTSISGNLYGGILKGSANLSWQGGWQLQGRVNISAVALDKALPGMKMSGDMEGEATLVMSGAKLMQLASASHLEGAVRIKDGAINSMDIGETARSGRKQPMSGITNFETLSGALQVDSSGKHLKQIKISAGSMIINGSADVGAEGQLTGLLLVDMNKMRAGMGTMPLSLSGTVAEPVWSVGRK